MVIVAAIRSQVIYNRSKRSPDHRDGPLRKAGTSTSKIIALGKKNYRPKIFYKENKSPAAVVAQMSSWENVV